MEYYWRYKMYLISSHWAKVLAVFIDQVTLYCISALPEHCLKHNKLSSPEWIESAVGVQLLFIAFLAAAQRRNPGRKEYFW